MKKDCYRVISFLFICKTTTIETVPNCNTTNTFIGTFLVQFSFFVFFFIRENSFVKEKGQRTFLFLLTFIFTQKVNI